jgi:hypothetical protein
MTPAFLYIRSTRCEETRASTRSLGFLVMPRFQGGNIHRLLQKRRISEAGSESRGPGTLRRLFDTDPKSSRSLSGTSWGSALRPFAGMCWFSGTVESEPISGRPQILQVASSPPSKELGSIRDQDCLYFLVLKNILNKVLKEAPGSALMPAKRGHLISATRFPNLSYFHQRFIPIHQKIARPRVKRQKGRGSLHGLAKL